MTVQRKVFSDSEKTPSVKTVGFIVNPIAGMGGAVGLKGTTAEDTKEIALKMKGEGVDVLVFCGGDGTARDILKEVGMKFPVLGVPTGVKMHSAVFAVSPQAAARVAARFLSGEQPLGEGED